MTSEAQKTKILSDLAELLKLEENKRCAECGSLGPRWASVSLGVFLCLRCAGIHRGLGPHISKVKSLTLDTWTAAHVQFMKETGNAISKAYFEATLSNLTPRPTDDRQLVSFVKKKYEQKIYVNSPDTFETFKIKSTDSSRINRNIGENIIKPNVITSSINQSKADVSLLDFTCDESATIPRSNTAPGASVVPVVPVQSTSNDLLSDIFSSPPPPTTSSQLLIMDPLFSIPSQPPTGYNSTQTPFSSIDNIYKLPQQSPPKTNRILTNEEILSLYNISSNPVQLATGSPLPSSYSYKNPTELLPVYIQPIPIQPVELGSKANMQPITTGNQNEHITLGTNVQTSQKMSNAFSSSNRGHFSGNHKTFY